MLFNELRKQNKLAAKRHPMYDKNRFGKIFMYFMAVFWAGYLIFFGTTMAFAIRRGAPNMEPYHILNSVLPIFLLLDFLLRFPFQKTPTQEVKPYLLLPVKKNRVLDFLLLRSGLSSFNLLWLLFFVPFALITVTRLWGFTGIFFYSVGIYLLMLMNNYWYLLCRTLMNEKISWVVLPVVVYGLLGAGMFLYTEPVGYFFMDLGEGFIMAKPLSFLLVIAVIAILWVINRGVMTKLVYSEINKVADTKVKNVSEYKFLERYGEIGEYFRLELKMLFRNKRTKSSLRMAVLTILMFSLILSFMESYDGMFMRSFVTIYSFVAFGIIILTQIMGYEGNYLDGLMTRKESLYNLLRAKYYLYSLAVIIPFVLFIPAIVMGKLTVLTCLSFAFFSTGVVYFTLFQLAVYNNKTVPLNEGISGRQNTGTGYQNLVSFACFFLPVALYMGLNTVFGETITQWVLLALGLLFTCTAHYWIKNVYNRFMKRRYINMEGFRDTK